MVCAAYRHVAWIPDHAESVRNSVWGDEGLLRCLCSGNDYKQTASNAQC